MAKVKEQERSPLPDAEPPPAPVAQPAQAVPLGFEPIDKAPRDGRAIKLWFGAGKEQMTDKYMVLGRWRRSRQFISSTRSWENTGFWCHPHSNLKIGFDFTGWQPVQQVTQADIDASNSAVHQENLRREAAAQARKREVDGTQARAS